VIYFLKEAPIYWGLFYAVEFLLKTNFCISLESYQKCFYQLIVDSLTFDKYFVSLKPQYLSNKQNVTKQYALALINHQWKNNE